MVAIAPVPANELARLDALYTYRILDTPADERFDVFTRLCNWIYHTPISGINLIDADRTFFKSLIGFPAYTPRRATSICAHAVGGGEPIMVVEDLAQDPRFADHPLVTKGLRFYAGALLQGSCGYILGTLCIGDTTPRSLDIQQRQMLLELAKGVSSVLDLHRSSLWLLQVASEDTLTGLCNRRLFMDRLHTALQSPAPDSPCVLLYLDLDGFKQVNDKFGHAAGDALLQEVGRRLKATVRPGDIVARLGGDEFAILLHEASTISCAETLSHRVLEAFTRPFAYEAKTLSIRGSIGIAACTLGGTDLAAADLMRYADNALYEAKQAGRGCYRVHRPLAQPVGG